MSITKNELLSAIMAIQKIVDDKLEPSREKSLVITKLDEAYLWLAKAVVLQAAKEMMESD
jgi:hypothetical protein